MTVLSVLDSFAQALTQPQGAVIAAVITFMAGAWSAGKVARQKNDELFFSALNFLKGGSQNRNLGISAIALYFQKRRHRELCVSLLSGTAIYLIRGSKQSSAAHELFNLNRVMNLLLRSGKSEGEKVSLTALRDSITAEISSRVNSGPSGLHVSDADLSKWEVSLTNLLK
jgi:hypothetical protein